MLWFSVQVCSVLGLSLMVQASVFLDGPSARQMLSSSSRRRRANSFLEEVLGGDLERECMEERCSQEEAAEIFITQEKTLEFWFRYINLNPCQSNPCLNGGVCTLERGHFLCLCAPQYYGSTCDLEVWACHYRNGGCAQYCRDLQGGAGVQCGCAEGFRLEMDGRSCAVDAAFPCGRQQEAPWLSGRSLWGPEDITMETEEKNVTMETEGKNVTMETEGKNVTMQMEEKNVTMEMEGKNITAEAELEPRIVGGNLERRGGSPWQVLIRRSDGFGFCGGALVSDLWVVSAAHCFQEEADHVTVGDLDKRRPDDGEQRINIQQVFVHPHFHSFTFDSDVALVLLTRPILRGPTATPACLPDAHLSTYLLREQNHGVVTGWGATYHLGRSSRFLRKVVLPVVSYKDCSASTRQVITDNMFCAGYLDVSKDSCSGDSGGPFVVNYKGTWFLTGVVSWGEKCAAKGKYGVYTRLGNFLSWIRETMGRTDLNGTGTDAPGLNRTER
ncbi:coagulation factor X [Gouania willdenowi]|uniref:coagulation factor X n=1 Tax=Gouania willdenowi TaxID=441366 RepID=UPI001056DDAC|nr:coagulation factor X-like [Gouania willdenowi]